MSKSPTLVTGAAGFIGMHVTRRLLEAGQPVVGLDNMNSYYDPRIKEARLEVLTGFSAFQFEPADVVDRKHMAELFAHYRFSRVIHLAAQAGLRHSLIDPFAYIDANLVGFANVLEGCRHSGCRHLLYASSSSVYGANTRMPLRTSDNVDHPLNLYGASKKANELMAHAYAHLFALPVTGFDSSPSMGHGAGPIWRCGSLPRRFATGRRSDCSTLVTCDATSRISMTL